MPHKRRGLILPSCVFLFVCASPGNLSAWPQAVDLELESGGDLLQGRFFPGGAPGGPTVMLLPDLPGTDVAANAALGLGTALSESGLNVLTFNYRGTHGSEGAFTLSGVQQDADAARRWLRSEETASRWGVDPENLIAGGYGVGGGLALAYASTDLDITAAFSIAGFDQAVGIERYARDPVFARSLEATLAGNGMIRWERGDFFAFVKEAMQGSGRWDLRLAAPQLARKRLLLVGALDDARVPFEEHILPLYRTLRSLGTVNLDLVVYQDDHGFERVREALTRTLIDWIKE